MRPIGGHGTEISGLPPCIGLEILTILGVVLSTTMGAGMGAISPGMVGGMAASTDPGEGTSLPVVIRRLTIEIIALHFEV